MASGRVKPFIAAGGASEYHPAVLFPVSVNIVDTSVYLVCLFSPLCRYIQANPYSFTVKIIHHIKGTGSSAADLRIVHKINGPALFKRLRRRKWRRIMHWQPFAFPYDENSVSAGSKSGELFYDSRHCLACAAPETAS